MPNRAEFAEAVGDAYQHLYDLVYLRTHPLTDVLVPDSQMRRKDKAWQLHQILVDLIDELDPGAQAPPMSPPWRRYRLMSMRYLEGIEAQAVADQLAISRRHFYRERDSALEAVSDILWHRYMENKAAPQAPPRTGSAHPPHTADHTEHSTPSTSEHFQLLRSETANLAQSHTGTRPARVLLGVIELLGNVAQQQGLALAFTPPDSEPEVTVDANILRHLIVGAVGYLLKHTRDAQIRFQIETGPEATSSQVALRIVPSPPVMLPTPGIQRHDFTALEELALVGGVDLVIRHEHDRLLGFTLQLPLERQQKILVVDDNADTLELFQRFLVSHRYQVFTAQSAQEAQELAIRRLPHAIIIDLMMPERDGWDILQTLRNHPTTQPIPVLVCSILPQADLALALGATAFLEKPFSEESLVKTLHTVLNPPLSRGDTHR